MRTFRRIEEFKTEASNALFTKQQALSITLKLFELELADTSNSNQDKKILNDAIQNVNINYFDMTSSETDKILDLVGVARLNIYDISNAIDTILFECK